MNGANHIVTLLIAVAFVLVGTGYILFSDDGLVSTTISFFKNLLSQTI